MDILINKESKKTISSQLYDSLVDKILRGVLKERDKLPSTRELSKNLGISRNIVISIYEQLMAEGYTYSKKGDGTYITPGLILNRGVVDKLSKVKVEKEKRIIDFKSGLPDLNMFPTYKWLEVTRETLLGTSPEIFSYGKPEGVEELREEIASYVGIYRGVICSKDQVIITGGTTQAIGILCKILLKENKNVFLEDPITKDLQEIIRGNGGEITPLPLDSNGVITKNLKKKKDPSFIYLTPSHQYPTGVTLSVKRRVELINYIRKRSGYIVEDDYDSEFRYDVKPTPSLQGLAPEKVIYIGTFSKILSPGLRTGYLILPPELLEMAKREKWNMDLHNPILNQLILASFMKKGYLSKTIKNMKKSYKLKREFLVNELNRVFTDSVEILGDAVGIHIAARFNGINFTEKLLDKLKKRGVKVYAVREHIIESKEYSDTIIIGFGYLSKESIKKGITILYKVLFDIID